MRGPSCKVVRILEADLYPSRGRLAKECRSAGFGAIIHKHGRISCDVEIETGAEQRVVRIAFRGLYRKRTGGDSFECAGDEGLIIQELVLPVGAEMRGQYHGTKLGLVTDRPRLEDLSGKLHRHRLAPGSGLH